MIRISLISKHYKQIEPLIQQFFNDLQIEYKLTELYASNNSRYLFCRNRKKEWFKYFKSS